jgi:hypothetical protein
MKMSKTERPCFSAQIKIGRWVIMSDPECEPLEERCVVCGYFEQLKGIFSCGHGAFVTVGVFNGIST